MCRLTRTLAHDRALSLDRVLLREAGGELSECGEAVVRFRVCSLALLCEVTAAPAGLGACADPGYAATEHPAPPVSCSGDQLPLRSQACCVPE